MARKPTGQVIERRRQRGVVFALRFRAYGRREFVTLGLAAEGWNRKRAEEELSNVLADVRRGIWRPPIVEEPETAEPIAELTFHEFSSQWLAGRAGEISDRTMQFYEWALSFHLLPHFARLPIGAFDGPRGVELVDDYRRAKVAEADRRRQAIADSKPLRDELGRVMRPLSATSINKTIEALGSVLELAVEYGRIARNPAKGRRRLLKPDAKRPVHLDAAEQIAAVLDAASELDASTSARTSGRRPLLATLVLAGLRVGEACDLRWRDVDLANGRLHVGRSKTAAGVREVQVLPLLRDELAAWKATSRRTAEADRVFTTATGAARDKDNVRARVLAPIVVRADELLVERGLRALPAGVTPHKLRHTFASVLIAMGEDPASVMSALGHTDPKFTLKVYSHAMRRGPDERARLRGLVDGELDTSALLGTSAQSATPEAFDGPEATNARSPASTGLPDLWS